MSNAFAALSSLASKGTSILGAPVQAGSSMLSNYATKKASELQVGEDGESQRDKKERAEIQEIVGPSHVQQNQAGMSL